MSTFLSMVHAIAEDSLVFIALGASIFWVVVYRIVWAALVTLALSAVAAMVVRRFRRWAGGPAGPRSGAPGPPACAGPLTHPTEFPYCGLEFSTMTRTREQASVNVSMKSRYAVRALIELARYDQTQSGKPVRLDDIAVLEVVAVLDGVLSPAECTQGLCEKVDGCGAASVWIEAREALEGVLGGTTIGDLLAREEALRGHAPMYHI